MTERAMATIRRINKIEPIEGADKIVCATVGGWKLVTAIANGFKEGDLVVYCEIDSWIPTEVAPFLTKAGHSPREYDGVKGEKLRTIRLRGQISQGLIMPVSILTMVESELVEDLNVTLPLGIQKWEPSARNDGVSKGNFPSRIPKTDQERIQNLTREFPKMCEDTWEITEKLEGSSMTVYCLDGVVGVCSRNLDLLEDESNTFWRTANQLDIVKKLKENPPVINFAIQGELVGPGIQDNIYKLDEHRFYVYDVYLVDTGEYMMPDHRRLFCTAERLNHVPVIEPRSNLCPTIEQQIALADGKSLINPAVKREGLVFKSNTTHSESFKAISNLYLMGQKD